MICDPCQGLFLKTPPYPNGSPVLHVATSFNKEMRYPDPWRKACHKVFCEFVRLDFLKSSGMIPRTPPEWSETIDAQGGVEGSFPPVQAVAKESRR
jgi:hypothetical protein